ncbi:MucBP domain-containing protein [Sporolactobacillus sp. KGMB 08714]|uniref:MucBP domain-containing protein n=1 Tax=Sporolactobacillus sp. KGMB 08714 TaxID=3064704 RepID=UPI002FBEBC47
MKKRIINVFAVSMLMLIFFLPILQPPQEVQAATIHAAGDLTWYDSAGYAHTTAYLMNGSKLVYCFDMNSLPASSGGTGYNNGQDFNNSSIISLLYYGYGGAGYRGSGAKTDYVKTWVALNLWKLGKTSPSQSYANTDPFIQSLYTHARKQDKPGYNITFSTSYVSSSIQGNVQQSSIIRVNGSNKSYAALNIPSGVTIHVIGGAAQKGGSIKVWGGQSFYFTALLSYNADYKTGNVNAWEQQLASILYLPNDSAYQPVLQTPSLYVDPTVKAGFTVHFFVRQKTITIIHKNKFAPGQTFETDKHLLLIGSKFNYGPKNDFISNGMQYDPVSTNHVTGTVPSNDETFTLYYKLRRTVTVNYLDSRTGKAIAPSKSYTKHQGDAYSETSPTNFKNGSYTYHYVKETGSAQSGTIGTGNVVINYYYQLPLIKIGIDKLQIYTAPAAQGLPVKVYLDKTNIYPYETNGMATSKINISLYHGNQQLATQQYSALGLPTNLQFSVPSRILQVDTHQPYTVRLENYDSHDFDVIANENSLTTDGYASSQETVGLNLTNLIHGSSFSRVVMTEITPTTPMQSFYETFHYNANSLPAVKSGYGVKSTVTLGYSNELGTDYQTAVSVPDNAVTFEAPKELQDSDLNYPINGSSVEVPMTASRSSFTAGGIYYRADTFQFPHINVERDTGYLFTDQEVSSHDSRITQSLINGYNEFYTPIWPKNHVTLPYSYPVDYCTNSMGVNQVTIKMYDALNIYAYMYGWMGSPTIKDDNIIISPVDSNNPFPDGIPKNWSSSDVAWLKLHS